MNKNKLFSHGKSDIFIDNFHKLQKKRLLFSLKCLQVTGGGRPIVSTGKVKYDNSANFRKKS